MKEFMGTVTQEGIGGRCRNYPCSNQSEFAIGSHLNNPGIKHFICRDCLIGVIKDAPSDVMVEALEVMDSAKLEDIIDTLNERAAPTLQPAPEPDVIPPVDPAAPTEPAPEVPTEPTSEPAPEELAVTEPETSDNTGGK